MTSPTPVVGDLYATLGVPRDATTEDIKKAFRKLARQYHPDVAGDDPDAARRFDRVRKAYEILVDPVKRKRYEEAPKRRAGRRTRGGDGYRMPGGLYTRHNFGAGREASGANSRRAQRDSANNMGLDDLFGDFGFGAGGPTGAPPQQNQGPFGGTGRTEQASRGGPDPSFSGPGDGRTPPQKPSGGRDITMVVDVPADIAARGGTVTLQYPRMRRTDDGRGVARYDEIHDLRVPPGTRHGDTLRARHYGDAGTDGSHGDLVCDIRVFGQASQEPPPGPGFGSRAGPTAAAAQQTEDGAQVLLISLVEALLGGRVPVETPTGRVMVTIRPGTSEGTRLRLKGRGPGGSDLQLAPRIVLPQRLDEESIALIERFAELNPVDPRA